MKTVETVFQECGGVGRFQLLLVFLVELSLPNVSWSMLFMSFGGKVPEWFCETSDWSPQENQTLMKNSTSFLACSVNGTRCERYRYVDDHLWTVMKEWDLVCDLEWVKATVTSIQMAGVLVGAVFFGQLSDRFGRKPSFFFSVLLLAVPNIATAFSASWQFFAVGRFFIGVSLGGTSVTSFTYAVEFITVKWRAVISLLPAFQMGTATFGLLCYLFPNWIHLHLASGIWALPVLLAYLWLPESPRWLTVQGRIDEAVQAFQKVARINGRQLRTDTRETLEAVFMLEKKMRSFEKKYSYLDLFKTWKLTRITVTICIYWFSFCMIFYGINFGVSSLSGNLFINIVLMGIIDIPLLVPCFYLTNKLGRRWVTVITFGLSSAVGCACLALVIGMSEDSRGVYLNWLSLMAKAAVSMGWQVVMTWTIELFPTVVRNVGLAAGSASARIGSMLAPFLIDFDESVVQTYILVGALSILMVMLAFTLEETKDKIMADTFEGKETLQVTEQGAGHQELIKNTPMPRDTNGSLYKGKAEKML